MMLACAHNVSKQIISRAPLLKCKRESHLECLADKLILQCTTYYQMVTCRRQYICFNSIVRNDKLFSSKVTNTAQCNDSGKFREFYKRIISFQVPLFKMKKTVTRKRLAVKSISQYAIYLQMVSYRGGYKCFKFICEK